MFGSGTYGPMGGQAAANEVSGQTAGYKAVEDIKIKLIVVTEKTYLKGIQIPKNVEIQSNVYWGKLDRLIYFSKFVIIPLYKTSFSAGQSVLLRAMAMGKAVIVTKTGGTIDYVDDGNTGIFVEPGNIDNMRDAINFLLSFAEQMEHR